MNDAKIYLCKADNSLLGSITGIIPDTCNLTRNALDLWELTFDVNRYIDADGTLVQSDYYDSIDEMMRIYLDGNDTKAFFVINSEPKISGDGSQEVKSVTAHSIECELSNINLKNFKINCGTSDSQEYLACDIDENGNPSYFNVNPYTGLPCSYISLVNYDEPQLSLLHLALQGTGWRVKEGLDADVCQIKKSFETSDNIYSFLMKTVSPAASVIFEFDRKNKQVGIVSAEKYGKDTGVFVTMRNLMNSFEVSSTSNESIITKLTPTGADNLGIEYVNFGSDYIINLDYFMNTLNEYGDYKYVSAELHDKYNAWKDYREKEHISLDFEDGAIVVEGTRREVYRELSKLYNKTISDISELRNRLPNDGCMIDYKTYKLDELKTAYTAYNNALAALITTYKNEYGVSEIDYTSGNYTPTPAAAVNIKDTPYWYDFYAYKEKIIPSVEEAFKMYCKTDKNGNLETNANGDFIELENGNPDYYKDYNILKEVNSYLYEWSLYGLDELEAKKKAWSEAANLLYDECFVISNSSSSTVTYRTPNVAGWNSLSSTQKANFASQTAFCNRLKQYLDYMSPDTKYFNYLPASERYNSLTGTKCKGIIRQCEDEIAKRKAEISDIEYKQNSYYNARRELADSTALNENFKLENNSDTLFTSKDIDIINSMINEQDFNNENILITSLDDIDSTVDAQEELYQSAFKKLYEVSQPQYSFRTELDNLYSLDEFKAYQKPFEIGNFIRVGIEIHEEINDNNFIKLRLISISHNPLIISENLSVEFSTVTKSLNGISDLAFLLDNENSSGGGSSSSSGGGSYGSNDTNVQISNNMLNALLSTEMFGTAVNDVILDTIKANKGNFNSLFANSGVFNSLETGELKINGDCLFDRIKSKNYYSPSGNTLDGRGSNFNLSDGTFESYTTQGNYIINDGRNLKIKMSNFQIDEDGNANFKGDITGSNGVIDGVFIGETVGSLNIAPGLHITDDCFLKINLEFSGFYDSVDLDFTLSYYNNTPSGFNILNRSDSGIFSIPSHYAGMDEGKPYNTSFNIPGNEINAYSSGYINIHSVKITKVNNSSNMINRVIVTSLEVVDANNVVIKHYDGATVGNNVLSINTETGVINNKDFGINTELGVISGNQLSINTETGLINGNQLSIDTKTGLINGGTYAGTCAGSININNSFIVEKDGKTNCSNCSNMTIVDGQFIHQIKRYPLSTNGNPDKSGGSIWKDQDGNEYFRNILMDNRGLSIETNRSDGLSFDSSNLLFKDRQFALQNDDDGEISLYFYGPCDDSTAQSASVSPDNLRASESLNTTTKMYDKHLKNRIDIDGMHGELSYYKLVSGVSISGSAMIKEYHTDTQWHYGESIICTKAYEQKSFSGLSKRTLYIGSDGSISAASSSRRFKQDISCELDSYFDPHSIYNLPVCQFRYNSENGGGDDSQLYIGFIAEDVANFYPPAARWNNEHTEVDTWEMSDMFPAVVKLVQEQHDELEDLKRELAAIKELLKIQNE